MDWKDNAIDDIEDAKINIADLEDETAANILDRKKIPNHIFCNTILKMGGHYNKMTYFVYN